MWEYGCGRKEAKQDKNQNKTKSMNCLVNFKGALFLSEVRNILKAKSLFCSFGNCSL